MMVEENERFIREEWNKLRKYCLNRDVLPEFKTYEQFHDWYSTVWYYSAPNDFFRFITLSKELIAIDYGISELIESLNRAGFFTKFCCSGHLVDNYRHGYIYFDVERMSEGCKLKLLGLDGFSNDNINIKLEEETTIRLTPRIKVIREKDYFEKLSKTIKTGLGI